MPRFKSISYIHFDTIDSTNTWTKNNAETLDPDQVTCITALEQTSGRGRWLRKWLSPHGQNIYATVYFCVPKDCKQLANVGQVLSLSCADVLKKKGFDPQIKWPNDLLLQGKKVAGVLCDTVSFEDRIGVVLGIGLNVNMSQQLLDSIDQPATSLAQLSGQTWTVEQILNLLLDQFLKDLNILLKEGFEPFRLYYEELLAYKGLTITCNDGIHSLSGICHSVNSEGRLNLLLPSGQMKTLSAGEVKFHNFRCSS